MEFVPEGKDLNELAESDEFYRIILYLYHYNSVNKADKTWRKFVRDLIFENRFSSKSDIISELHSKKDLATHIMPKGQILYRARIFNDDLMDGFVKNFVWTEKKKDKTNIPVLDLDPAQILPLIMCANSNAGFDHIIDSYKKWKKKRFKGYNKQLSGAPPKEIIPAGRANPEFVRYLYLCEDEQTTVYEIHPTIGQEVSIAKFKTIQDLKIYDLTLSFPQHYDNPKYDAPSLYDVIGKNFSIPNTGDAIQYLPTQFISEEIKNMGFDGLRFNSSLRQGGINIVLFKPENCNVMSSDIVKVKSIEIEVCKPDIYDFDNMSISMLDV